MLFSFKKCIFRTQCCNHSLLKREIVAKPWLKLLYNDVISMYLCLFPTPASIQILTELFAMHVSQHYNSNVCIKSFNINISIEINYFGVYFFMILTCQLFIYRSLHTSVYNLEAITIVKI